MSFVSQADFCFSSNKQFISLIFHILPEFFYFTAVSFWNVGLGYKFDDNFKIAGNYLRKKKQKASRNRKITGPSPLAVSMAAADMKLDKNWLKNRDISFMTGKLLK